MYEMRLLLPTNKIMFLDHFPTADIAKEPAYRTSIGLSKVGWTGKRRC